MSSLLGSKEHKTEGESEVEPEKNKTAAAGDSEKTEEDDEMAAVKTKAHQLIRSLGTKTYHMEYQGFLTNHLAHGVWSLANVGAPMDVIEEFANKYKADLEPPQADDGQILTALGCKALFGQRKQYPTIRRFYELATDGKSVAETLQACATDLIPGLPGAALHPLIHMGYAVDMDDKDILLDAIAYAAFSWRSVGARPTRVAERVLPNLTQLFPMLQQAKAAGKLRALIDNAASAPPYSILEVSSFQRRFIAASDVAVNVIDEIVTSSLAGGPELDEESKDMPASKLTEQTGAALFAAAVQLYAATNKKDFFLLHGVTSSWALHKILPLLTVQQRVDACWMFCRAVLAAYVIQGEPDFTNPQAFDPVNIRTQSEPTWDDIKKATYHREDEHDVKIVHHLFEATTWNSIEFRDLFYQVALEQVRDAIPAKTADEPAK